MKSAFRCEADMSRFVSSVPALGNRRIGARMNHLANADLNCDCASIDRSLALRPGGLAATEAEVMMMLDESSPSHSFPIHDQRYKGSAHLHPPLQLPDLRIEHCRLTAGTFGL